MRLYLINDRLMPGLLPIRSKPSVNVRGRAICDTAHLVAHLLLVILIALKSRRIGVGDSVAVPHHVHHSSILPGLFFVTVLLLVVVHHVRRGSVRERGHRRVGGVNRRRRRRWVGRLERHHRQSLWRRWYLYLARRRTNKIAMVTPSVA